MHGNGGDVGLHARVADVNFIYPNYVMISTENKLACDARLSRDTRFRCDCVPSFIDGNFFRCNAISKTTQKQLYD